MSRRAAGIVGAVAVLVGVLVVSSNPASAAGTLSPWSSSVAIGARVSVTANGCPRIEEETDTGYQYQEPQLMMISGTGADERMVALGMPASSTRYRFQVPSWVDPAKPAVVAGKCVKTSYDFSASDESITHTTVFTYPDAPIDITPGTAVPSGPIVSLDRNTAAGGQVIKVTGSQCQGSEWAEIVLSTGTDLSGRSAIDYVAGTSAEVQADGTFAGDLTLNTPGSDELDGGGPLPEGGYTLLVACAVGDQEDDSNFITAELQPVTVSGTNPSGDWEITASGGTIRAMGSGCTGGQQVTVHLEGYAFSEGIEEVTSDAIRARATRSLGGEANLVVGEDGDFSEDIPVTPEPDGTWMVETEAPEGSFDLQAYADCGDPTTTGFRYVYRYLFESNFADLYIDRASPTSSPTGGTVMLEVNGYCDGDVAVAILDRSGKVLDQSGPIELNDFNMGSGTVTAPSTPGSYLTAGMCDDELSYPDRYDVFTPKTVSAEAPLAAEPTEGWPSQGARETYHGKIGPITLPAMDMGEMAKGTKAMGPSGLFIPVPRPTGDFAITKLSFDLVDAEGMPVTQEQAHLHHFVITNKSKKNPACPGSTFGLPGQIVGAAGAERTVLQTSDPYGLVVKSTDQWTGVYELMSRSMEPQTVYLSYEMDYRRDVQNVRPVTTYFGSATGCNTFTWTIDGSGTPDEQAHYITIAKSGRLIGAGGHIHNGGLYADWTNDRGRRLCRSEISYGDEPVGHHMDMARRSGPIVAAETSAVPTTMVEEPEEPIEDEWPPEFYDDDLAIEGISNCPLAESVTAGEKLLFSATYDNERARSGVMGIYTAYVWEGGGPADPPGSGGNGAEPIPGNPNYTG